jgi:hypothetical protein
MDCNEKKRCIYLVGGSKGGVGKSLASMALLDFLIEQRKAAPILIECDTSNPDVYKSYRNSVTSKLLDLDEVDGWIELVNLIASHPEQPFVIATPARNNAAIAQHGALLANSLEELNSRLVTFWLINRQRDSLELLKEYLEALPCSTLHVVRNTYFGHEPKFEIYNDSKLRQEVEARGGKSLSFPDLADRVSEDLYCARRTIAAIADRTSGVPLGNRAEILSWRRKTDAMFEPCVA